MQWLCCSSGVKSMKRKCNMVLQQHFHSYRACWQFFRERKKLAKEQRQITMQAKNPAHGLRNPLIVSMGIIQAVIRACWWGQVTSHKWWRCAWAKQLQHQTDRVEQHWHSSLTLDLSVCFSVHISYPVSLCSVSATQTRTVTAAVPVAPVCRSGAFYCVIRVTAAPSAGG